MTKKPVTYETVYKLGLELPGVEESTSYGARSLKMNGVMFACPATNKSAEPHSLMVRLAVAQRDELIEADPGTYYVTDHYAPYPCVVVRLSRVHPDALKDLLRMSYEHAAAKARQRRTPTRTRSTPGTRKRLRRPT